MQQSSRLSILTGSTLVIVLSSWIQLARIEAAQAGSPANRNQVFEVTSKDGTRIAVECAGTGPTLLFVHGGVGDHTRWTPMFPLLTSKFTACAMDRRGHGGSGDSGEYSLSKEAEDVAAVVNSYPGPVFVFGHSYGGVAALEATFLTDRIAKLMLYEPPLHEPVDNNLAVAARLEAMAGKGELEEALITFQTEIVKQSPAEIARMKERTNMGRAGRNHRGTSPADARPGRLSIRRQPNEIRHDANASVDRRRHGVAIRQTVDPCTTGIAAAANASRPRASGTQRDGRRA